ncbi:hypothetical protein [Methylomonas albis]|uniref:Uncharacterized protein n=1 Tax=Methylomonas albis TaxID=1854563 RepID=A0ABR9D0Z6_9GAMM|nr:hypothetical protein [Methylomonas albis]MBD9356808.1 hypothetical protein [Methylomonas albis]CAD6879962.1 hypothetical protein [Methylomonas albis]
MKAKIIDRNEINEAQHFVCHVGPIVALLETINEDMEFSFEDDESIPKVVKFKDWLATNLARHQAVLDSVPSLNPPLLQGIDAAIEVRVNQIKNEIKLHDWAVENLANLYGAKRELLHGQGFSIFEIDAILPEGHAHYYPHFGIRKNLSSELEKIEQFVSGGNNNFDLLDGTKLACFVPVPELAE